MIADLVDQVLEASVVGSFTSVGYGVRRWLRAWNDEEIDVAGRRVLVTGGTTGLGRSAAETLARRGADVLLTGRDAARVEKAAAAIREAAGRPVTGLVADLADLDATRRLAATVAERGPLDLLVHNAGALTDDRRVTVDGLEETFQVHLVAPVLLTHGLVRSLAASSSGGRIVWVTSGGMYTERLDVDGLEMPAAAYRGTTAYARAKRAQVELLPCYAECLERWGVTVHAMHPGWADTPGVAAALPTFRRVVGPLLRTPEEGADTIVWLAGAPASVIGTGRLWLDRAPRATHKVPWTRADDPDRERGRLRDLVVSRAGIDDLVPKPG